MTAIAHVERDRRPSTTESSEQLIERLEAGSQNRLAVMVIGFWGAYWLLNGLDKFFSFGLTTDGALIDAVARTGLSDARALMALRGAGVIEMALGTAFVVALVSAPRLRGLTALCFEASLAVFMVFALSDLVLGNRAGLWQHMGNAGLIVLSIMFFRQARQARSQH